MYLKVILGFCGQCITNILTFFIQPLCCTCNNPCLRDNICKTCQGKLNPIDQTTVCSICGYPGNSCTLCKELLPQIKMRSAVEYNKKAIQLTTLLKYNDKPEIAKFMCLKMLPILTQFHKIDIVTCVPMHPTSTNKRMYNQSALLGLQIAKATGAKFVPTMCSKVRKTKNQSSLARNERLTNLNDSFSFNKKFLDLCAKPQIIAIVDDVITTGSTIRAVSKTISASAPSVTIIGISFARTIL